jgi:hypothetical protein
LVAHGEERTLAQGLESDGIGADAASVEAYLRRHYPTPEERREIEAWVSRLGAESGPRRREASRRVAAFGVKALAALEHAGRSSDTEVRRRAVALLERARSRLRPDVLLGCFRAIREEGLGGLAPELLATLDLWDRDYLRAAAVEALQVTVGPQDAALLDRARRDGSRRVRCAAILASASLHGRHLREELIGLLRATEEPIRLAAARALAEQGDRACLHALVDMLDADDPRVRQQAAATLRGASGRRFGYWALSPPGRRAQAVADWRAWIAENGSAVRWSLPLPPAPSALGRTLISLYTEGRVLELDALGRQVWELEGLTQPWACAGLPNGHRLLTLYRDRAVVEYDNHGREVWRRNALPGAPSSVQRLENGNTLVACTHGRNAVIEIEPAGTIEWQLSLDGRPTDAKRVARDRTLVTLHDAGRVIEVDRAGGISWSLDDLNRPYSCHLLESGNMLVVESHPGRVLEYTREGKRVWSYSGSGWCYCAQRLPNGDTLVADRDGVRVVDREGRVGWTRPVTGYLWAVRY